jgi:DNA-binding LacI/PurR family transcriptional regulator
VAEIWLKSINTGEWPEGRLLPSHSQLSGTHKVGKRTIRRALDYLAGEKRIELNLRRQWVVKKTERSLSFYANCVAVISAFNLVHYWSEYNFLQIRKGLETVLAQRHNRQIYYYSRYWHNRQTSRTGIPNIRDAELRGILLHGLFSQQCLRQYSQLDLPVVLVDSPAGASRLASVCLENMSGAKDAVARLAQLGHRRIAFCRYVALGVAEVDSDSKERQIGFLDGLKERGIRDGQKSIFNFMDEAAPPALRAIFEARPRYTAMLAADPGIARKISKAAAASGLMAPRDLSIVCFDGMGSYSKFSGPRSDLERLGREAAELLESRAARQIRIPSIWHDGSTIGPAPAAKY